MKRANLRPTSAGQGFFPGVDFSRVFRRKVIIVFIFVLAAFLTPPDVVTQVLMGVPLVVLYEASILLAGMVSREEEK